MKQQKKVLIICDLFPPAFGPRMGYLCKYLKPEGWEPVVITENIKENASFQFLSSNCEVHYVDFYSTKNQFVRTIQWIFTFIAEWCFGYKNRKMYRIAKAIAENGKFDLILCSTFRLFPLPAAHKLAKKLNLPLVADLRDIIEQYTGDEFIGHKTKHKNFLIRFFTKRYAQYCIKTRNRLLKHTAATTTVSPWHTEFLKRFNPNTFLIYNGYDPGLFFPKAIPSDTFQITYTGRLLSMEMQNPSLLFESLLHLHSEKKITPEKFKVCWYTTDTSMKLIKEMAEKFGISQYMQYSQYVPAEQIPDILNRSSILLILTNHSQGNGPKGIMTTKFFEALAVGKPILCVPSDNGCLEATILQTKSGIAAHSVKEVSEFLLHYYAQWEKEKITHITADSQAVSLFSREKQAKQFIRIFEEILKET